MRKKSIQSSADKTSEKKRNFLRFVGLSLSGGKSDKSSLSFIDYYEFENKIFLSQLHSKISSEEFISADQKIFNLIFENKKLSDSSFSKDDNHNNEKNKFDLRKIASISMDVPLSLPKCLRCKLKCPGFEICKISEIVFMRGLYENEKMKRKPKKFFNPYMERVLESYLSETEPLVDIQHAMGANMAPLLARGLFLKRRFEKIKVPILETLPKLAVLRLGQKMKINLSSLRSYKNSVGGLRAREIFLEEFVKLTNIFIYKEDLRILAEDFHAFDSFISAYVGFLKYKKQTQRRPKNFPKNENWIELPFP